MLEAITCYRGFSQTSRELKRATLHFPPSSPPQRPALRKMAWLLAQSMLTSTRWVLRRNVTMMKMIQRTRTGHAQSHLCCKHILRGVLRNSAPRHRICSLSRSSSREARIQTPTPDSDSDSRSRLACDGSSWRLQPTPFFSWLSYSGHAPAPAASPVRDWGNDHDDDGDDDKRQGAAFPI